MKSFIVYAFIMVMISDCNKYDNTLEATRLQVPPYTESGANTIGCLINGAPWANLGETNIRSELSSRLDSNKVRSSIQLITTLSPDTMFTVGGTLSVSSKGHTLRQEYLNIYVPKNGNLKGTHQLNGFDNLVQYNLNFAKTYSSLKRSPFTVIIGKDSVVGYNKHIVSGKFYGTLYSYDQTDSVRVSGGVFDTTTGF